MRALVHACLSHRWVVVGLAITFVLAASRLVTDASFDAFPEFAPPRVEIQVEAPGLSSEDVEVLVTTPIEAVLAGMPRVTQLRSRSVLGLSSVVLLFRSGTDLAEVRALVSERLARVRLPLVARPPVMLAPLSSTSRILKIGLFSSTRSQLELTDLARWVVRPRLMTIPGVANVAIWGERDRQLQVRVDPDRLHAHGVSLDRVLAATRGALAPRAGGFLDSPTTRIPVLHVPSVSDAASLGALPLAPSPGRTLALRDVADVVEDAPPAIGDALVTRGGGLLLIVEKQPEGNTLEITHAIDAALAELAPALPGVEADATIFRPAGFIERALANLGGAMGIGCLLVVLVLGVFLWDLRTAFVSVTAIPLSLLAAAAVLTALGRTIDTMVIAGLVIALGEVVDDAIIDVENIHRRLHEDALARGAGAPVEPARVLRIVLEASLEVRSAIVYASLVVMLVFVPVLFLDGIAGEFFRPLALTYGLAVLASTAVALTVTPVLSLLLLRRDAHASRAPLAAVLVRAYAPLLHGLLTRPRAVMAVAALGVIAAGVGFASMGDSFLPAFQENDFLMHWIARPGTSLEAVRRSADLARAELLEVPGVRSFGAHLGRAEVADEVVGPNFAELWISVDPEADLPATRARVSEIVDGYPGVYRDVQTYLQERMREVLSGGSGAIVLRIYGSDLAAMRERGAELAARVEGIDGVAHARPEAQVLVPELEVRVDHERCGALGIDPSLVSARASTLVAGETVGQIVRGAQPLDVVVWSPPSVRVDVAAVRDLGLAVDERRLVRLGDVASVRLGAMPNTIAHDAGSRKLDVIVDLTPDADLGAVAADIDRAIEATTLPAGHHVRVLGEHQARAAARQRLGVAALFAVVAIVLVLLVDLRAPRLVALVCAGLPFALVGGVAAAWLAGGVVSIGTLVGLVTVIGIAARNGILLVSHFRHLEEVEGVPFGVTLVARGASERLTPIVMTALATGLALVPLVAAGQAPGHEIEHPMAVVILGGLASSTVLTLLVTPVLYLRFGHPRASAGAPPRRLEARAGVLGADPSEQCTRGGADRSD
ncbi:MAG: efflux RND transporter permease subunit [Sandaracinaceae bacterium]|nr:efflux RND transporter permease subunit [Sandaracinaceae bacterium]